MSRPTTAHRLEAVVVAWTVFTTAFLWTATMRGLFRPDISTWSVLGLSGTGRGGSFWVFPALAMAALVVFYLYGRRLRSTVHGFVLVWHGLLVLMVAPALLRAEPASFEGATWGVQLPLWILVVPVVGGFVATGAWVLADRGAADAVARPWGAIDGRALALAVALLPVAAALFAVGDGVDWPTRGATAAAILQWVLLAQAVSHAEPDTRDRHSSRT